MSKEVASEIHEILVEAWNEFLEDYNKYPKRNISSKKDAEESHWICWNEYDLMFHIGRLFYKILEEKKEEKYSNIQIHFEKNINISNFKEYEFEAQLKDLKDKLEMSRGPKVDMIIAYEDNNDSFLLCAEIKYFHGRPYENPTDQIDRDIKKLRVIRDCKIAKKTVFMLLDDYYYYTDKKRAIDIKNKLDEIERNQEEITILFSNTESKLYGFE